MKHTKKILLSAMVFIAALILPLVSAYAAEEDVMFSVSGIGGNHQSAYAYLQFRNPNLTVDDLKSEYITVTGDAEKDTNRGLDNGVTAYKDDYDGLFKVRVYIKNAVKDGTYNIVMTHPTLGTYTSPDRLSRSSENGVYGKVLDEQGKPYVASQGTEGYTRYIVRLTNSSGENIISGNQTIVFVNEDDGTFDLGVIKGYEAADCVVSIVENNMSKPAATKTIDTTKDNYDVVLVLGGGSVPEPVVDEPEVLAPVTPPAVPTPLITTVPVTAAPTASTVLVNGSAVAFEAYNIEGSNYLKLRDLAYVLSGSQKQFDVGFDSVNNAIALTSGMPYTVTGGEMAAGDGQAKPATPTTSKIYLNGGELSLTVYNIGGNNFFKLVDLMNVLNIGVTYNQTTGGISIDTNAGFTGVVTVS